MSYRVKHSKRNSISMRILCIDIYIYIYIYIYIFFVFVFVFVSHPEGDERRMCISPWTKNIFFCYRLRVAVHVNFDS